MPTESPSEPDTTNPVAAASSWGLQIRWMMWIAVLGYCAFLFVRGEHGAGQPGNLQTSFLLFAMWILPLTLPFLVFETWRHGRRR